MVVVIDRDKAVRLLLLFLSLGYRLCIISIVIGRSSGVFVLSGRGMVILRLSISSPCLAEPLGTRRQTILRQLARVPLRLQLLLGGAHLAAKWRDLFIRIPVFILCISVIEDGLKLE